MSKVQFTKHISAEDSSLGYGAVDVSWDKAALFDIYDAIVNRGGQLGSYLNSLLDTINLPEIVYETDTPIVADTATIAALYRLSDEGYLEEPSAESLFEDLRTSVDGQFFILWATKWARNAFPVVQLGARLGAALTTAAVDKSLAATMQLPWNSFLIKAPEGLITLANGESVVAIRVVQISTAEKTTINIVASSNNNQLWERGLTYDSLCSDDELPIVDLVLTGNETVDISEQEKRVLLACRRLVRGVILWLIDPSRRDAAAPKVGQSSKARKARQAKTAQGITKCAVYQITGDIKVDCRPILSAYIKGEKQSPNVRSFVRGHYRNQVHGKNRALRKCIWIEPFWRGGEELPIAVRKHNLGNG